MILKCLKKPRIPPRFLATNLRITDSRFDGVDGFMTRTSAFMSRTPDWPGMHSMHVAKASMQLETETGRLRALADIGQNPGDQARPQESDEDEDAYKPEEDSGLQPALPILVDDIEIDGTSMWEVSRRYHGEDPHALTTQELNGLRLGPDWRIPAAYVMVFHFTNRNPESVTIGMTLSGHLWHGWWKEKDPQLSTCIQDLALLKKDVNKNATPPSSAAAAAPPAPEENQFSFKKTSEPPDATKLRATMKRW